MGRKSTITIDGLAFTFAGDRPLGRAVDVEYTAEVCNNLMGCAEVDHGSPLTIEHLREVLASENAASASGGRYVGARLTPDSLAEGPKIVYSLVDDRTYLRAAKKGAEWTLKDA